MKKRYSIFRIVFLSTVSICLIFVLTYLSKSEKKFFNFIGFKYASSDERLSVVSEKTIDLNNVNDINFNLDVDDITFIENTDEKIKIVEKCTKQLSENEKLQFNHQNNKIDIYRSSKLNINDLNFENLIKAVTFGNKVSSIAVQREGAQPSIPTLEEVIKIYGEE